MPSNSLGIIKTYYKEIEYTLLYEHWEKSMVKISTFLKKYLNVHKENRYLALHLNAIAIYYLTSSNDILFSRTNNCAISLTAWFPY